jgi:hypothetical protein
MERIGELEAERDSFALQAGGLRQQLDALQGSRYWRYGAPLRLASRNAKSVVRPLIRGFEGLAHFAYHRLPLGDGLRWQSKRLFFGVFRRLLPASESLRSFENEKSLRDRSWRSVAARDQLPLTEAAPGMADVFVWGVIDWHFRFQRPQQLAREFARCGHRVFYVSANFVAASGAGFEVEQLDPELALFSIRLQSRHAPILYAGPPAGSAFRELRASIRELLLWVRPGPSVCILDHPAWFELAEIVPAHRLVYDWMDHHPGFAESGESLSACEQDVVARADLVVTTSRSLESQGAPCSSGDAWSCRQIS